MSIIEVILKLERASNWLSFNLGIGVRCFLIRYFLGFDESFKFLLVDNFNPKLESPNVPVVKIRSPFFAPPRVKSFFGFASPIIVTFIKKHFGEETVSPPKSSIL